MTMAVESGGGPAAAVEKRSDADRLERLMLGYQRAEPEAARQLIEALSPMLLRFLAGPLHTRPFAEDMLQDSWLRIHKARHTYRPGTRVLPWIFAIARHTRIDAYRRRRRIDDREQALEDPRELRNPPSAQTPETDLDIWRLVEQLPASQQEVIRMLKVLGMSLEEVARATGCSVGAVKQKAHRAYEKLRTLLKHELRAKGTPT